VDGIGPSFSTRRRERLRAKPFPAAWREISTGAFLVAELPRDLRRQLEQHIQVFIAEKPFVGMRGPGDRRRSARHDRGTGVPADPQPQVGLLPESPPDPRLPGRFPRRAFPAVAGNPVLQSYATQTLTGESWTDGRVVISWEDALEGAAVPDDGRNVVIHEFAHQLDQQKGYANGAPWLGSRHRYPRWSQVLGEEYARLQQSTLPASRRSSIPTAPRILRNSSP
jgi:Mlc titration factor MtfA (ptsG expression regulator)